jgi:lipopolysaccharide/colanic/teichoic acid biosynthesis glycosyltransferase
MMTVYNAPTEGWPQLVKRIGDIAVAAGLLVLLAPVFLATAVLVKTRSPGPVFFMQERIARNGRRFRMYKFRTMCIGAESQMDELEHLNEVDGAAFKLALDPRITKIGSVLRKYSIDELPQLVNVLKGEMSMVGPRPLPIRDFERFHGDEYRRRFSVVPGLTGLWQVSGRNLVDFSEWMELDLKYVDQWTLGLDLHILAKTLPAVFKRIGAM